MHKKCITNFRPLLLGLSACVFFLIFPVASARAAAVIETLDVHATITEKGVISVEETLTLYLDGPLSQDLTRGISGHYAKSGREKSRTGFVLLSATMDGHPTRTAIKRQHDILRLVLASKNSKIESGRHIVKLKYELINMIVFLPEQDQLIWSLVRDSSCPINRITVDIALPNHVPNGGLTYFSAQMEGLHEGDGVRIPRPGELASTIPLPERHSMTLYLNWEKGLILENAPGYSSWRFMDFSMLLFLTLYYLAVWYFYGKVPKRTRTPQASAIPPAGLSPGLLRYIKERKTDVRGLASEILNLAVKGYVHLDDFTVMDREAPQELPDAKTGYSPLERMMGRRYRIRLTPDPEELPPLNPTEKILLHNFFSNRESGELVLDKSGAASLKIAFRAFSRNLKDLGTRFFFRHMRFWAMGLFVFEAYTAFVMFNILSQGVGGMEPNSEHALAFMAPLFLLVPLLGEKKEWRQSTPFFVLRTSLPLFFCACALAVLRQENTDITSVAALIGCIIVIGIFWKMAPVYSPEGIRLLDEIEGFCLAMESRAELKEEDTLEKFETLFPYACAMDRERPLIARYDSLVTRTRHHARWRTSDTHSFNGGAEYYTLSYELLEAIQTTLLG